MDYRIPKYLMDPPPEAEGKERKWQELFGQYLEAGLEDISTEALSWDQKSRDELISDLEYCIKYHINYYDLHPERREPEDGYY